MRREDLAGMLDQNDAAPMLSLTVVLAKQAVGSSRTW